MTPNCFTMVKGLPFFASGPIISGFGRGSKQLGIPTANYPDKVVDSLPPDLKTGIYFGWAQVDSGPVYKMVMSIGWNPFFKNMKKSMETHILHKFDSDLYGCNLKTCLLGYLREEKDFSSIEELIKQIQSDVETAAKKLDDAEMLKFKTHSYFSCIGNCA